MEVPKTVTDCAENRTFRPPLSFDAPFYETLRIIQTNLKMSETRVPGLHSHSYADGINLRKLQHTAAG